MDMESLYYAAGFFAVFSSCTTQSMIYLLLFAVLILEMINFYCLGFFVDSTFCSTLPFPPTSLLYIFIIKACWISGQVGKISTYKFNLFQILILHTTDIIYESPQRYHYRDGWKRKIVRKVFKVMIIFWLLGTFDDIFPRYKFAIWQTLLQNV